MTTCGCRVIPYSDGYVDTFYCPDHIPWVEMEKISFVTEGTHNIHIGEPADKVVLVGQLHTWQEDHDYLPLHVHDPVTGKPFPVGKDGRII